MLTPSPAGESLPPSAPALPDPQLLAVPAGFCLVRFVERSPAPVLPPLCFDATRRALQLVVYRTVSPLPADAAPAVDVLICQAAAGQPLLVYGLPEAKSATGRRAAGATWPDLPELQEQVETQLGLNEDLSLFYAMTSSDPELSWVAAAEAGRTLRAPRVFEDLLKALLRSRCAAKDLPDVCARLCLAYGPPTTLNRRGFPTADVLARATQKQLESKLKVAAPVAKAVGALARFCADGRFYPESMRRLPRDFAALLADAGSDEEAEARVLTAVDAELEWQLRVAYLLEHLPGCSERVCGFLYPQLACHGEPLLDMATLRAWQARPQRRKVAAGPPLRAGGEAAAALVQRMLQRVGHYAIYTGLAQRLLLQGPPSV